MRSSVKRFGSFCDIVVWKYNSWVYLSVIGGYCEDMVHIWVVEEVRVGFESTLHEI
jgi:hypothetical protein